MKYIDENLFLKESKKVQSMLKEWWKPSDGDLYLDKYENHNTLSVCFNNSFFNNEDVKNLVDMGYAIPLFTESNLRQFIGDKTGSRVVCSFNCGYGYNIELINDSLEGYSYSSCVFESLGDDLLLAYWKVVCNIASNLR